MQILFENDELLIVNKPAGLLVHPDGKRREKTLVDWIVAQYPEVKGVGEPMVIDGEAIDRPGIVHRLDEETSGALVIAKTKEAFEHLKAQFQAHAVEKEYHAFLWGHFKESSGVVDAAIGRNKNDFRRWHAGRGTRGEVRDALTKWEVIDQFFTDEGEALSFVRLFPKTGRTHQLRVHMKYLQRPIVADTLYAPGKPPMLGLSRVALHARRIAFADRQGRRVEAVAPYPADFGAAVAKYVKA